MSFTPSLQPVTFHVPSSAGHPIEIEVLYSGLDMVLVSREAIHILDDKWKRLGVYFLLGPGSEPEKFQAYVGEVGKRTLYGRIKEHAKSKDWWNRALLISRDGANNFNSAEIGWLEGRLYDLLHNAVAAEVRNGNRPGDESLDSRNIEILEKFIEPIAAALRACGAAPDTADQLGIAVGTNPADRKKSRDKEGNSSNSEKQGAVSPVLTKKAYYSDNIQDLLQAGLLQAGTSLYPTITKYTQLATVLEDGTLQVGDTVYKSASSAAMAVLDKNRSINGWDFWQAPSGDGGFVTLSLLRAKLREQREVAENSAVAVDAAKTSAHPDRKTYDLASHLGKMSPDIRLLFDKLNAIGMAQDKNIEQRYARYYISYTINGKSFFTVVVAKQWLKLCFSMDKAQAPFWNEERMRDITGLGHQGLGDIEYKYSSISEQLEEVEKLVYKAYELKVL